MGFHVPMHDDLTIVVQDADVHGAGMPVDATIKLVRRGVASPEVSSSAEGCFPNASSPTVVCRGGGLNQSQGFAADAQERAAHAWPLGAQVQSATDGEE